MFDSQRVAFSMSSGGIRNSQKPIIAGEKMPRLIISAKPTCSEMPTSTVRRRSQSDLTGNNSSAGSDASKTRVVCVITCEAHGGNTGRNHRPSVVTMRS